MILKEVTLKKESTLTLQVDGTEGLKYAVVADDTVLAILSDKYWAKKFMKSLNIETELRELAE